MSDDLPTEERLRRIERGVQRRIDARRATAQRIGRGVTGGLVAVLLIGGGFALLRPTASTSSGSSAAGSSGSVAVPVVCHDGSSSPTVRVDRAGLPSSALKACSASRVGAAARPDQAGASGAPPTPPTSALCRAQDGALHVYPGAAAACRTHGMVPFAG